VQKSVCWQNPELLSIAAALAVHMDNWELGSIVSDVLSSAPNSVKKSFPNAQHHID
jgi:hypothetical protein